jgi:hypothetical protein
MTEERCRPLVDDSGQVVAMVRGETELDKTGRAAMLSLVAAIQRDMDTRPGVAERQAEALRRIRLRLWRRRPPRLRVDGHAYRRRQKARRR